MIISAVLDSCRDDDLGQELVSTIVTLDNVSPAFHIHVLHITGRILTVLHHEGTVLWTQQRRALFRDRFCHPGQYTVCDYNGLPDLACGTLILRALTTARP